MGPAAHWDFYGRCISVHNDPAPAEVLGHIKGVGCTLETLPLYDLIAPLDPIALQHDAFLTNIGEALLDFKFEPQLQTTSAGKASKTEGSVQTNPKVSPRVGEVINDPCGDVTRVLGRKG